MIYLICDIKNIEGMSPESKTKNQIMKNEIIRNALNETKSQLVEKIETKKAADKKYAVSQMKLDRVEDFLNTTLPMIEECANDEWWNQFAPESIQAPVNFPMDMFGEGLAVLWGDTPGNCGENNRWSK